MRRKGEVKSKFSTKERLLIVVEYCYFSIWVKDDNSEVVWTA